jgi:hypothetical protein
VEATFAAFAGIGMASWIAYWFDPARPQSAGAVAKTMTDIFIGGLLSKPGRQSRAVKNVAAVALPGRRPKLVAARAAGRSAKRRA